MFSLYCEVGSRSWLAALRVCVLKPWAWSVPSFIRRVWIPRWWSKFVCCGNRKHLHQLGHKFLLRWRIVPACGLTGRCAEMLADAGMIIPTRTGTCITSNTLWCCGLAKHCVFTIKNDVRTSSIVWVFTLWFRGLPKYRVFTIKNDVVVKWDSTLRFRGVAKYCVFTIKTHVVVKWDVFKERKEISFNF